MLQGHVAHRFLYLSRLATGVGFNVFGAIVSAARVANAGLGIAGVLLFDGERFCQLLEGETSAVQTLAARIEHDPRHRDFTVLYAGPAVGGHLRPAWRSGYCGVEDLDCFESAQGVRGADALAAFLVIAQGADLSF